MSEGGDRIRPDHIRYSLFSTNQNFTFNIKEGQTVDDVERYEITACLFPVSVTGSPYSVGGVLESIVGKSFRIEITNDDALEGSFAYYIKVYY